MNDRLTTAVGVLVALLLVAGIFLQSPAGPPVSRPTSAEHGPNGFLGLRRWLESQGVQVVSSRERFHELAGIAAPGSLLISTVPHERAIRGDELASLMTWVDNGNTLLVLAALNDTPDWSLSADSSRFLLELEQISGITFEAATNDEDEPLVVGDPSKETLHSFVPVESGHPLIHNLSDLTVVSDSTASVWQIAEYSTTPGTAFLRESSTGLAAAWTRPQGRGHIITIAAGSIFSNRVIGKSHNRLLLANLLQWHLGEGGAVIFDDLHQGLSTLYDPEAFYSDRRLGISVAFILAFWFIYMIGSQNRMLPLKKSSPAPEQGDFVAAMGGFLARKTTTAVAGRMIIDRWLEEMKTRGTLPAGSSPWTQLSSSPLIDAQQLTDLRGLSSKADAGEKLDLKRLHNLIQRLREALG